MEKNQKNYIVVGASDDMEAVATDKIYEIYNGDDKESFNEVFFFNTVKEIENYKELGLFIKALVDISMSTLKKASKKGFNHFIINGVSGETDLFLWGIDIKIEGKDLTYGFIDWNKDGQNLKFE